MSEGRGSIKIEGDMVVIRVPLAEAHSLRVALEPCPCKATKSAATASIRERIAKGLVFALAGRKS
ncbi:hypothetical protein CLG85_001530 [Yangia mangrovi]|uniref:Uncharacterized protein n=1 Tax=Alloyangia mangrovi TaxID=1779329 RepID=A0A2A3K0V2_9RHOB|nr:hypothetical protein [Alloyangia mangrovi]MCT4369090.1 hypothetical protein [Alloyangia mangrovi]